MASSKEIIANSINKSIEEDTPIELMFVAGDSRMIDLSQTTTLDYIYIGMSGRRFVDMTNANTQKIAEKFNKDDVEISLRIISNQIKEVKIENGIFYYTTEAPTTEVPEDDERTWIPLETSWGKIQGDITKQSDLQQVLSNKAPLNEFTILSGKVSNLETNVATITGNISTISSALAELTAQISGPNGVLIRLSSIENTLSQAILSDTVKQLRVNVEGNYLEYTLNGTDWTPVSTVGTIEWGDILGDITNQSDLQLALRTIINQVESQATDITEHTTNTSNPHNVSKEQLGLGNVDNTSDIDKPVSTAQQQAIDDLNLKAMPYQTYKDLATKQSNTIYIITDK